MLRSNPKIIKGNHLSEDSKECNRKIWEEEAAKFRESLKPYEEEYGAEMVERFWEYWSEPNRTFTAMRFEDERKWFIKRRLATWNRNEKEFYKRNEYGNQNWNDRRKNERAERAAAALESMRRFAGQNLTLGVGQTEGGTPRGGDEGHAAGLPHVPRPVEP